MTTTEEIVDDVATAIQYELDILGMPVANGHARQLARVAIRRLAKCEALSTHTRLRLALMAMPPGGPPTRLEPSAEEELKS